MQVKWSFRSVCFSLWWVKTSQICPAETVQLLTELRQHPHKFAQSASKGLETCLQQAQQLNSDQFTPNLQKTSCGTFFYAIVHYR